MAFLYIAVPLEVADLLSQIPVPDEREPQESYHITLAYLGDDTAPDQIAKAMAAASTAAESVRPFVVSTCLVTSFPGNPSGVPVIAKVESPALITFQAKLLLALDAAGVEYSKKYPEYRPHITLAYAKAATADLPISPLSFTVPGFCIRAANADDPGAVIRIPFAMGFDSEVTSLRVAARFQRATQRIV
jgi:2'-5' RNA ligase